MNVKPPSVWLVSLAVVALGSLSHLSSAIQPRRNAIIFISDAMRHGSINAEDTPSLWAIRNQGVHFDNSHSVFPTFTTANGSVIATGHGLGDTGDFSNVFWPGFATFDTGNFGLVPGTPVPFVENDRILADLAGHYNGNYLGSDTLLMVARAHGYHTAAIGKLGPTAIQDIETIAPVNGTFSTAPAGIVVDDATGSSAGPPLPPALIAKLRQADVPVEAPTRSNGYGATSPYNNGYTGDRLKAGTLAANAVQQQWMADVATRAVLPMFAETPDMPFVLVFWSRDPDGSQHNHGDSLGALAPGVNGETSKLGVRNADRNFQQLMAWLDANPAVKANTNVFVTSDHGVGTISRREIDRTGRPTSSESAKHDYIDANGQIDTVVGTLPFGFVAIDLALALRMNLFDPDAHAAGSVLYKKLNIDPTSATWEHPVLGNGLIGVDVRTAGGTDARVIVAANGGSDLIYVPDGSAAIAQRVVTTLLALDYVSGIFVDDKYGALPGTLALSAIGLEGSSKVPRPAVVVAFKVFYLNPDDLQTAIQISDTVLQEGQGMHGGFGRDSTFNNMAALGPDFKPSTVDDAPMGNIDIAPTLAHVLGLPWTKAGISGRVLTEALAAGSGSTSAAPLQYLRSTAINGRQTLLIYQERDGVRYSTTGCFVDPSAPNGPNVCR